MMQQTIIDDLEQVSPQQWNKLAGDDNPFVRHEFLVALERHNCVGETFGWIPQHVCLYKDDTLVAAMPMYLKDNSYGEFVFDWAWADAYQRNGLNYYPKLVTSVPYTPATGPRLLIADEQHYHEYAQLLIQTAIEHAQNLNLSSCHWLFTSPQDTAALGEYGLMLREGCQFHWHNNHYNSFDDFLAAMSARKRKKINRERRYVSESDVRLEVLTGSMMNDEQWEIFHHFYASTFAKKSGHPTLQLDFFREIGQSMSDSVLVVLARRQNKYVAGTFNMLGRTTLYGRHWGCNQDFHSLHFECCYYTPIEYCIRNNISRFEAGAQGEHKISRGFLPVPTWSAHWVADAGFRQAIGDFVSNEQRAIEDYMAHLYEHSPYKDSEES